MNIALNALYDPPPELELPMCTATLATGLRMRFVDVGDGAQLPLILIHGLTDSWFSWSPVIHDLAVSRRVVAMDLRGHGGSSRPAEGYSMAAHADDVFALMNALGIARAVVIGHSMGSFIARRIASMDPERVAGLVLVGTGASPKTPATLELAQAVAELSDHVPRPFVREFQYGTIHRPLPTDFMDRVVANSRAVPVHVWRAALSGMMAANASEHLRVPTMIVRGEHDQIFSAQDQRDLLASNPHAVFETYADTGHAPQWERPEQFVSDVERFCAQL